MNARAVELLDRALAALLLLGAAALPLAFDLHAYDPALLKSLTLQAAAILAAALWLARGFEAGRFELRAGSGGVFGLGCALLAWTFLSRAWTPHPDAAFFGWVRLLCVLALFLAALAGPASTRLALSLADWTLAAAGLASLYALAQLAGLDPLPWAGSPASRPFSTLGQSQTLGAFAAAAVPLAAARAADPESGRLRRALAAGAGLLSALAVWAAGSLAGAAALVAGCACYGVRVLSACSDLRARRLLLGAILAAAAVVVAAPWPGAEETLLAAPRVLLAAWQGGWDMLAARPIAGWGAGGFAAAFPGFRPEWLTDAALGAQRLEHPGSEPLLLAVELGLLGLGLALALAWAVLSPAWRDAGRRLRRGETRAGAAAAALWASCAALLAASLASPILGAPPLAFLLALSAACLAAMSAEGAGAAVHVLPVPAPPLARLALARLAALGGAACIVLPVFFWLSDRQVNAGVFLARRGDVDGAVLAFRWVWARHPHALEARYLGANLLARRNAEGDAERARAEYAALEFLDPGLGRLPLRRAEVELRLARWTEARASLRRSAQLKPWVPETWERLIEAEWILRQPEEARRAALALVRLEPNNPERWRQLAQTYRELHRPLVARRMERQAARVVDLARTGSLPPVY
ncbi:MAG: tetratricopeptide repeat protein [Elusimicrobia bacterium]|nr:tetratricopeptide repeat protein [Elusimicrobiota bacterium]